MTGHGRSVRRGGSISQTASPFDLVCGHEDLKVGELLTPRCPFVGPFVGP